MPPRSERFEMRVDEELLVRVDAWRSRQADVPSRAEAMRRLIELGLGPSSKAVNFSDGEKVLMLMMKDLRNSLKLKDSGEIDAEFMAKVIFGGHYWAPSWKLSGLFHNHADRPEAVSLVANVLDMWSFIESSYKRLPEAEKTALAKRVPFYGKDVRFVGFDGNNEGEEFGIARFLVDDMNRFSEFKGRELNSHSQTLDRYRRMLTAYAPMRATIGGTLLTSTQIGDILEAGSGRA